tara:strand:+ start:10700 stop:11182 length:483 start_codon:yes stop_codon:yes gene_type:complete
MVKITKRQPKKVIKGILKIKHGNKSKYAKTNKQRIQEKEKVMNVSELNLKKGKKVTFSKERIVNEFEVNETMKPTNPPKPQNVNKARAIARRKNVKRFRLKNMSAANLKKQLEENVRNIDRQIRKGESCTRVENKTRLRLYAKWKVMQQQQQEKITKLEQ